MTIFYDDTGEKKYYPDGKIGWYVNECKTCKYAFRGFKGDTRCGVCEERYGPVKAPKRKLT